MAEAYDTTSGDHGTNAITVDNSHSRFSCFACRKRKLKCDRNPPRCTQCNKATWACEWPTHAEKPGPKPGSTQRKRRRRLESDGSQTGRLPDGSTSATSTVRFHPNSPDDNGDLQNATSPGGVDGAASLSPRPRRSQTHQNVPLFSRIMYPSHDAQTRPTSPSTPNDSPPDDGALPAFGVTVGSVCESLKITRALHDKLLESYFANMTAFALFKPGVERKLYHMHHQSEADALAAAMFSFAARHVQDAGESADCPAPAYFAQIASTNLHNSLDRYGDLRPPFWLVQASILVTFYHLTRSVRSRSWRTLGDCIRLAYDLNLHIVDANHDPNGKEDRSKGVDINQWSAMEERRRAWWAIWEMDVFASTIRQLPTAIDPGLNLTLLPVPDKCWFSSTYQESCFLAEDCSLRWKNLAQSGNKSSKAWFIIMNSLMKNTQRIVYPSGSAMKSVNGKQLETDQDELDIMANSLYCTVTAIPPELLYQGETLDFRLEPGPGGTTRQKHADKYALHIMTQLCRFMIYHDKICSHAPWLSKSRGGSSDPSAQTISEWSNYMNASDEICTVVRNSARDHYKFVNPFLANTLWFAAAAQCACRVFGPPTYNKRLTGSRLDLLKLTIDQYIHFWNGMDNLKNKLVRIEARLKNMMGPTLSNGPTEGRQQAPRADHLLETSHLVSNNGNGGSEPVFALDVTTAGQTSMVLPPLPSDMTANGFLYANSSFVPDTYSFTQSLGMAGQQDMFGMADPMILSPFGLEELLMAGMPQHF